MIALMYALVAMVLAICFLSIRHGNPLAWLFVALLWPVCAVTFPILFIVTLLVEWIAKKLEGS